MIKYLLQPDYSKKGKKSKRINIIRLINYLYILYIKAMNIRVFKVDLQAPTIESKSNCSY